MRTYADIAEKTGVSERRVREIAAYLGFDPILDGPIPHVMRGEVHWNARFTPDDVRRIRKLCEDRWSLVDIASEYQTTAKYVAKIRDGKVWAYLK